MRDSAAICRAVIQNIEKVLVGKKLSAELALTALLCEGHVLVEDVPGVGKTVLASALARSVDFTFRRIQFTPDVLPSDVMGFMMYNPKSGDFEYKPGLIFANFILADEINRTSPKTQSSLLEAMEEQQVTVDGVTRPLSRPFIVMATQNPLECVGTYPLPEAQLDRFFLRIFLGYPDPKEEEAILRRFKTSDPLQDLKPAASGTDILALQNLVKTIHVADSLYSYITAIVRASREDSDVRLGASPRAGLCLFRAAQACAMLQNRDFVVPDDVKFMALPVLAHRLVLTQEAKMRGADQMQTVHQILQRIPVPQTA